MVAAKPLFTGAGACYAKTDDLIRRFTWEDRFGREYVAYREEGEHILLPREVCPSGEDRMDDGVRVDFDLDWTARSKEQELYVEQGAQLLSEGRSFIAEASTGFGKTACAMPWIEHVGRKTLVIVPKSDLMRGSEKRPQWWEHIRDMLLVPEERIGIWRGTTVQTAGKDVVIGMLHSLAKVDRYPKDLYKQFGLVIFDETHRLPADQFANAAFQFTARYRIGLSATVGRKDGRDKLIRAHLGPVEIVAKQVPMSPKVLRYHWQMPVLKKVPHGPTTNGHVIKIITRNLRRNKFLAHLIGVCRKKERNVVVCSHTLEHLETLAQLARGFGVKSLDMGFYVGSRERDGKMKKVSAAELEKASVKPVVFATYGMVALGTNCPWWDAMILGTPKGDAKQTIGRILREYPDKKTPVVFDVVDICSELFTDWAFGRDGYYKSPELNSQQDVEIIDLEVPDGYE